MPAIDVESPLLTSLRADLVEVRRQLSHYARLTTSLELQLERLDREQTRAHRRALELANLIELEEHRVLGDDAPSAKEIRRNRRSRSEEAVDLVRRKGQLTAQQVSDELDISASYASQLLSTAVVDGTLERATKGSYRVR